MKTGSFGKAIAIYSTRHTKVAFSGVRCGQTLEFRLTGSKLEAAKIEQCVAVNHVCISLQTARHGRKMNISLTWEGNRGPVGSQK